MRADTSGMFSPRKRPLLLVADRLLSLRLSLNSPVVSTPDLPAGTARAAIAVHLEAGRTCFAVAVRSLRNGESVVYELEGEDLNGASGAAVALDAALSFGESMGFLFDDELVSDRREATLKSALAKLREIVAPPTPQAGETSPGLEADPPAPPAEEILLEEALELEAPAGIRSAPAELADALRGVVDLRGEPLAQAPAAPARPGAAASLTKFRSAARSAEPPEGSAPGPAETSQPPVDAAPHGPEATGSRTARRVRGAMLGRVKPVRLRSPEAPAPVPALLRLLSLF